MATAYLNPQEQDYFAANKRRINDTYFLNQQQNQYQQGVAGNNYAINQGNLIDQFAQLRNQIPGNFIHRGLINSGLYGQGLGQFAKNRASALGNLASQYQQQLGGFNLANSQLGYSQSNGLQDLESQRRARLATLASTLGG